MVLPHRVVALALGLLMLTPAAVSACFAHHRGPRHPLSEPRATTVTRPIRVHDGDTFYVGDQKIRLRGVDAPELGQPRAAEATRRLAQLLAAGPVRIVSRAEDVYGRTVADVFVAGRDVAAVLRREGFARRGP